MPKTLQEYTKDELLKQARSLLGSSGDGKVCVFKAPTGSGKTIMMAELLQRLGESGGTTYWDTHDGSTWTNRHSATNPITVTALYADLQVGTWAAELSTTTVKFDNFNLGPKNGGLTLLGVG